MTVLQGDDSRYGPATDPVRTGTWVMQNEAAARTGFSVSAIRKWRRMGLVADRKVTSSSGLERVEVKLEDVEARAAQQPDRRRPDAAPAEGPVPAGSVVITIEDLQAIFERMVVAERRAEEAEAAAEALRSQATFTFGQLAELRRQLQEATGDDAPRADPPPEPSRAPPAQLPAGSPAQSPAEVLGARLQRTYARLDEYRRRSAMTPEAERQHQRDLAEYDRTLVAVCDTMGIPTGLTPDQAVGAEERAALTRALAHAGLDVRAGVRANGTGRRPRMAMARRI